MFHINQKTLNFGGYNITIEKGLLANQTDSSIVIKSGNNYILSTVTSDKVDSENTSFLPLTVNYIEKAYAIGKIPGGFFKRENRPSEREILISRLSDRTIRPTFLDGFYRNISLNSTLLSYERNLEPDILSVISSCITIYTSGLPVSSLTTCCRVGYIDNSYVLNPTREQMRSSILDIVISCSKDSIFMVECQSNELSKDLILGALSFAKESCKKFIDEIQEFVDSIKNKQDINIRNRDKLKKEILKIAEDKLNIAYAIKDKTERKNAISTIKKTVISHFEENNLINNQEKSLVKLGKEVVNCTLIDIEVAFSTAEEFIVRNLIKTKRSRIDGREFEEIREIDLKLDLLPSVNGSALFSRGKTQVLSVVTLGGSDDEQQNESISDLIEKDNFMLHYNFPSYAAGETFPSRGPGRREIGHGKLAYKSIKAILPSKEKFPYTIRCVGEVMSSDGSTSMGTVCSSSMALMATGVPVTRHVAGIAMGLMQVENENIILTDIMADEDHLGDMDFKVSSTRNGIVALQMDIKVKGLDMEIMSNAVAQAEKGINFILSKMETLIPEARKELSETSPKVLRLKVDKSKIAEIIGKSGSNIKMISERTKTKIEINDSGEVSIFGSDEKMNEEAKKYIDSASEFLEIGSLHNGKIIEILPFGALIDIGYNRVGLIHISEISKERVEDVSSYLQKDQEVKVKFIGLDEKSKKKKFSMITEEGFIKKERNGDYQRKKNDFKDSKRNKSYDLENHKNKDRYHKKEEEKPKKKFFFF